MKTDNTSSLSSQDTDRLASSWTIPSAQDQTIYKFTRKRKYEYCRKRCRTQTEPLQTHQELNHNQVEQTTISPPSSFKLGDVQPSPLCSTMSPPTFSYERIQRQQGLAVSLHCTAGFANPLSSFKIPTGTGSIIGLHSIEARIISGFPDSTHVYLEQKQHSINPWRHFITRKVYWTG